MINMAKHVKSPFSLLSLSARKLFESQFKKFSELPKHTQQVLAKKLLGIFLEEASGFLIELAELKFTLREPLSLKPGEVRGRLNFLFSQWVKDIERARGNLSRLVYQFSPESRVRNPDVHLLMHYTECQRWIKEGILPAFVQEVKRTDAQEIKDARFKYYIGEAYFGVQF